MTDSGSSTFSMSLRSPQQRKEILRLGLIRAQTLKECKDDSGVDILENVMEESDLIHQETTLNEKISNQEEIMLDSEVMNTSSAILKERTETVTKAIRSYKPAEFSQKLIQYVQRLPDTNLEAPDWSLLEMEVIKYFKRTPNFTTLLGTLTPLEAKEVTKRKPVVRETQAAVKRPDNIVPAENEDESVETVDKIKKIIYRYYKTHHKPIEFFHLILHPDDFGKSVENMLHVSFLVRDGFIKLSKDEAGMLVIYPCSKEMTMQAKRTGKSANIQNVMTLTIEQWKTLKQVYQLTEPIINCDH